MKTSLVLSAIAAVLGALSLGCSTTRTARVLGTPSSLGNGTVASYSELDESGVPIQSPGAVALAGYYPSRSCVRYAPGKNEYAVSIEDFVLRKASPPEPLRDAASGKP